MARWRFNLFPAYRGTGAQVDYIAGDWMEVRIRLPLSWRTRNYVGTIFGGSMYGAIDPIYMLMLIRILGPEYVVWDKAASIRFRKPGRTTLFCTFQLTPEILESIRTDARSLGKIDREFEVQLVDTGGQIHATATKVIHIRWKGTAEAATASTT
jgi:acyl-coenzyme A thioesterase PaaI-like protein